MVSGLSDKSGVPLYALGAGVVRQLEDPILPATVIRSDFVIYEALLLMASALKGHISVN
jgi:hypothetical protein